MRLFCYCLILVAADKLSLGEGHSLIVKPDGSVWAAGENHFGQLGLGSRTKFKPYFGKVLADGAKAVAAGGEYSMLLKQDGSVWATGKNLHGQFGDGSNTDSSSFVQVIPGGAKVIAAGSKHSLVVKEDGSLWSTGYNMHGQLGDGSTADRITFARVPLHGVKRLLLNGAQAVTGGAEHSMVLAQDGSVWAAGANDFGQLGDGSTISKRTFVQILPTGAQAIAAGGFHSMVLKQDGTILATGDNKYQQVGNKSTISLTVMRLITADSMQSASGGSAKAIAAGFVHSMVLYEDGSVWFAGLRAKGTAHHRTKHNPVFPRGVRAMAAGYYHSMIMEHDGSFWAMGANTKGQLGDGSTFDKAVFVRVARTSDAGTRYMARVCIVLASVSSWVYTTYLSHTAIVFIALSFILFYFLSG